MRLIIMLDTLREICRRLGSSNSAGHSCSEYRVPLHGYISEHYVCFGSEHYVFFGSEHYVFCEVFFYHQPRKIQPNRIVSGMLELFRIYLTNPTAAINNSMSHQAFHGSTRLGNYFISKERKPFFETRISKRQNSIDYLYKDVKVLR